MENLVPCVLLVLLSLACNVQCRPDGAPQGACATLLPGHPGTNNSDNLPGGFFIYSELFNGGNDGTFTANTTYRVTLATVNYEFRGFLIQAVDASGNLIGYFTILDSDNSQLLNCSVDSPSATVTHTNNNLKAFISFNWQAPDTAGVVDFRYTVVTSPTANYYANISAAMNRPPCRVPPPIANSVYTFQYGEAADNYYLRIRANPVYSTYVDVTLEGTADGWVAVGFSQDQQMQSADVLGCRVDLDGNVTVVDTWNADTGRGNALDATQTDICAHSSNFSDGRITCSFSRLINVTDAGQDYNLDAEYWLFYGRRTNTQTSGDNLMQHSETPTVSAQLYNVLQAGGDNDNTNGTNVMGQCNFNPGTGSDYIFQNGTQGTGDYYVATRVNPNNESYLDIYLEGVANGWVALGLSQDKQMQSADVLGCRVDPDGNVTVVDTWNADTGRGNTLDDTQTDICYHSTSFTDGRITCSFSRLIAATDSGQDYNLDGDYWLFYGRRTNSQTSGDGLAEHTTTPTVSDQQYNIARDAVTPAPTPDPGQCAFNAGSGSDYIFEYGTKGTGNYYVATRVNPNNNDYLEIYLEGVADGWVALGFSQDQRMFSADVLGCRVDGSDVTIVDTWNVAPNTRGNQLDATQTDICYHTTSFTDGRITCRFSRLIAITDSGQDYNLDGDYWLFYGRSTATQSSGDNLQTHGTLVPTISAQRNNIARDLTQIQQCTFSAGTGDDYAFSYQSGAEDYFVNTRINPNNGSYLEFYLEGVAGGWVALGLSENRLMQSADVLGCRVDGSDVTVVDTWNADTGRGNALDATQTDICYHSASVTDGTITCRFSRLIQGSDNGQDYNLNGGYYLFYGRRTAAQSSGDALAQHTTTPPVSANTENISGAATLTASILIFMLSGLIALQLM